MAERLATTARADAGICGSTAVDQQVDFDSVGRERHVTDASDGYTAIGHFGVGEDATGRRQFGFDRVLAESQKIVQPYVFRSDIDQAQECNHDEGDQLPFGELRHHHEVTTLN